MARRAGPVLVVLALLAAACAPPAFVSRGRQGSWQRVAGTVFRAGTSHRVNGLAGPVGAYGYWAAVGHIKDGATGRTTAAAWPSVDGNRWSRADLDAGDAREASASAVAAGGGQVVVVARSSPPPATATPASGRRRTGRSGRPWRWRRATRA